MSSEPIPHIEDISPAKAQFRPGETVSIELSLRNPRAVGVAVTVSVNVDRLGKTVARIEREYALPPQGGVTDALVFEPDAFAPPAESWVCYGVDAVLRQGFQVLHELSTAFDIADAWKASPRYGFLSDFGASDEKDTADVEWLRKCHLNVVQFYDWLYRHDSLIPTEGDYDDPLGRSMSARAVRRKIALCHGNGMKALAYAAVYAASRNFYDAHPDWALYDNRGTPYSLGEQWLFIMNIAPDSPWTGHMVNEFMKAVTVFDFDGIHMDTYGYPKTAFSRLGGITRREHLESQFVALIARTRAVLERAKKDIGLIFNAVSAWPLAAVSTASQDAVYVEVWDPCERYWQLNELVQQVRARSDKPVILAAYLKPFGPPGYLDAPRGAENSFRLASAVIAAGGAYHLVLGEGNGILCDSYYVRYATLRDVFVRTVRDYQDFIVRYGTVLFDPRARDVSMTHANGVNMEYRFSGCATSSYGEPDKVWTIVKEMPGTLVINFINLTGVGSDLWNQTKPTPTPVEEIVVTVALDSVEARVLYASPDERNGRPVEMGTTCVDSARGTAIQFRVPKLFFWGLAIIEYQRPGGRGRGRRG